MININIKTFLNQKSDWKFDMKSMTEWPLSPPRSFIGKWRMNFYAYFIEDGKKITDCSRGYFEIADV